MPDPVILDERQTSPTEPIPEGEPSALHDELTLAERYVEPVANAIEARDVARIRALFDELHPADLADVIALLEEEYRLSLIELLGGVLPTDVLPELDPNLTEEVVTAMRPEAVAEAVAELDTDDAAFILEELDEEKRAEILAKAPMDDRVAIAQAFDYEEESAGRLMQRDVFASPAFWTVGQIIDRLRGKEDLPDVFYEVFVVDPANKPIGAVPLATLLKTQRDVRIDTIMNVDITTIPVTMDQEDVAYKFEQYNLISAPVVDEAGRLIGMITVDDVVEIVHAESHEDMLALGGVESDAGITDSVVETVRSRFSWLAVNLGTAILASLVISIFGAAIEQVVALAVLMPIVASMGGNAGTQTLTVAVRSLATRDLTAANAARIIWRETIVGGLNGILFALIMGALAGVWHAAMGASESESLRLALVIGAAMIINLVAAGLAGILVPLGLQRAGADPAVSSAVFVTTVTDVVGFFVFLGLAALVLL
ncbi:MAG: magnesium transporter [Parvularculaceae bacterium]|nr:magnesium transporter [Parvularculaceae bacterium]